MNLLRAPDEIAETFRLLAEGEKNITFPDSFKNYILLVGNTGGGKTTLAFVLATDNSRLTSKEVEAGKYVIEDPDGKISGGTESKTLFPEFLPDKDAMVGYYDCAGFEDTRGMPSDIAANFFLKQVIDHAASLKFLISINYASLQASVDRTDFTNLLQYMSTLVKDFKNFNNSVGIVATKVDNPVFWEGGIPTLVPDATIIADIGAFIDREGKFRMPHFK